MDAHLILEAYEIIGSLTPLAGDCGALCGAACCQPDEDGQGGMFLFPGEKSLLAGESWCRVAPSVGPGDVLTCLAPCPREKRPLACRIFPLTPVWTGENWTVRMDARARPMCPLCSSGVKGVQKEFALAVRRALRRIAREAEGEAFLHAWQKLEEQYRNFSL